MSTNIGAVGAKERRGALNFWILILAVAMVFLIINFYVAATYSSEEGEARSLVSQVQVESQQIAKFAQEAASGGYESFDMLDATRTSIQVALDKLKQGDAASGLPAFASSRGGVSVEKQLGELIATWAPVSENAEKILLRKELVLGLNDTASRVLRQRFPSCQAQMDEVVRAMSESWRASTQIYIANRQVVLANNMLRHVTQILQGGAGAVSAADRFSRDASMFGQVLTGLQNWQRRAGHRARRQLRRRATRWSRSPSSTTPSRPTSSAFSTHPPSCSRLRKRRTRSCAESADLLQGAQKLSVAYDDLPTSRISRASGLASWPVPRPSSALPGLLFSLYRDQSKRFAVTQELNQRNQEAILRLLDEMGSLAEGDLTVKATVTEDITGAIADSINFAVEAAAQPGADHQRHRGAGGRQRPGNPGHRDASGRSRRASGAADHTRPPAAINEIAVSIDEVSKNSAESADVAQRSVQIAAKGAEVVRQTIGHGLDPRPDPGNLEAHQAPRRKLAGNRLDRRTDQRHFRADQHPRAERRHPGGLGR
jgi:twitching motility protein PilJ